MSFKRVISQLRGALVVHETVRAKDRRNRNQVDKVFTFLGSTMSLAVGTSQKSKWVARAGKELCGYLEISIDGGGEGYSAAG